MLMDPRILVHPGLKQTYSIYQTQSQTMSKQVLLRKFKQWKPRHCLVPGTCSAGTFWAELYLLPFDKKLIRTQIPYRKWKGTIQHTQSRKFIYM